MLLLALFVYAVGLAVRRQCTAVQFQPEGLYYDSPIWPVNSPSVTIGTVRPNGNTTNLNLTYSTGAALTAFCQINFINRGMLGPSIKGEMNFKVYDSLFPDQTTQYYTSKLLQNSLYNLSTNEPLIAGNNSEKLGVVLLSAALGNVRAGYGVTQFYGIPFLDYGTQGQNGHENSAVQTNRFRTTDLYSLRLTQNFTMASAVFQLLQQFNWTLVSGMFEQSETGSYMLNIVQSLPTDFPITFVCNKQTNPTRLVPGAANNFIPNYCSCVKSYNRVGVIVIWGNIDYANWVVASLKLQCSGFKDMMFVVADDSDLLFPQPKVEFQLGNALWINSDGPHDFGNYLESCIGAVTEKDRQVILEDLTNAYTLVRYGCHMFAQQTDKQLQCELDRIYDEIRNDTIANEFFFVADAMTSVAEAIALIQNNCTFLNDRLQYLLETNEISWNDDYIDVYSRLSELDFCTAETFSPSTLAIVMRFVNFTGFTGPVSFDYNTLFRRVKPYYVYNFFNNSFLDNEMVGMITENDFRINTSRIVFPNNNATPVSEIIPDNPSLGDTVVDVFFAVFVFFAVAFTIVLLLYIYNRNEQRIRKNSPILSYVLLIGCLFLTGRQILNCMAATDAICIIALYVLYTGATLLFGALIFKHYRVYRIFHNYSGAAITISDWRLLSYTLLLWFFFMIVVTLFVIADFGAVTLQSNTNPFYFYVSCRNQSDFWTTLFRIVISVFCVMLVSATALLSFLTRKIPTHYGESHQIAMVCYTFVFGVVLVPLYFLMGANTDAQTFRFVLESCFAIISLTAILCILCLPNLYRVHRDKKRNVRNRRSRSRSISSRRGD